jgi:hypothetical protein
MSESSKWSRRGLVRAAVIAVVLLATSFAFGLWVSRDHGRGPMPISDAEAALIAPLKAGAALEDYQVREVHGVTHGYERLVCTRGAGVVQLDVALAGDTRAPATAGRYAIFYSLKDAPDADGQKLAKALAAIVLTHAENPPPPGMTVFTPRNTN